MSLYLSTTKPGLWTGLDSLSKMQNRNATDKLNQQCSKLALFANKIRITMLVYYIVDLDCQLSFCNMAAPWKIWRHLGNMAAPPAQLVSGIVPALLWSKLVCGCQQAPMSTVQLSRVQSSCPESTPVQSPLQSRVHAGFVVTLRSWLAQASL